MVVEVEVRVHRPNVSRLTVYGRFIGARPLH
jgi:hypothetical protein